MQLFPRHPESRSDERIALHPRLLRPWRESDPFTRFARSGWPQGPVVALQALSGWPAGPFAALRLPRDDARL